MVKKRKWNTRQEDPHQGILEAALSNIFPTRNVTKNVRKKVAIKNPLTGGYLEVDVWYADLKLCFEYQDEHHYQPSWYSHVPAGVSREIDEFKRTKLLQKGETLIEVPCWWDGTAESLRATINFYRPDLMPFLRHMHSIIIPANPPLQFFSDVSSSGDKQLMLASFSTSPEVEEMAEHNPWWLGEKYDGVRCFWNPEEKQLYSRNKQIIGVHPAVSKLFGDVALDGEIWYGRGHFLESLIAFNSPLEKADWALFRIVCFDEVSRQMRDRPFEARYWFILSNYSVDHAIVILAPRLSCSSTTALLISLHQVIDEGGEGVILRRPNSLYRPGRSLDLIKFKGSRSDQEALVVDVEEEGSLLLQLPNGTTFAVAKADCELPRRAVRGDVVTFTHDFSRRIGRHDPLAQDNMRTQWALTHAATHVVRSVPANSIVHRIRTDVIWEDVVSNAGYPIRQFRNESYQRIEDKAKPNLLHKFWEAAQNRRELLERFARSKGCDPLIPNFWYSLNPAELSYVKGGATVSQHYAETVVHLFPELHLDITKLKQLQSWKTEADRRAFFDKYAASKGMDPRNPDFWSRVAVGDLRHHFQPGFITIAGYYGGQLSTCLMQLYPDIGLKQSHFETVRSWKTEADRRAFFDGYAASKIMDPRNPDFWSRVTVEELRRYQPGYRRILSYHGGQLSTCLMQLYPDIGLTQSHFDTVSWKTEARRRAFFDNFAASKGMDPRNPMFWSRVTIQDLHRYQPGFSTIVGYHGGRLSTCLMQLYPDIGLKWYHFNPGRVQKKPMQIAPHVSRALRTPHRLSRR